MFNLFELEQFAAFDKYKTLTKVSEIMNISQPTLTRSMKHIENEFGVPLFIREKNKLMLNETGKKAVEYAKQILNMQYDAIHNVQEFDRKMRCITIESCAPKPLWSMASKVAQSNPENEITSRICDSEKIIDDVKKGEADIGILPFKYSDDKIKCTAFISEHLYICAVKEHEIYNHGCVSFNDLNGYNCLLRDKIGFWYDICKKNMPSSKFLIQTNEEEFIELVHSSSLLCFTTDLVKDYNEVLKERKIIPITDECANVRYYIIERRKNYGIH